MTPSRLFGAALPASSDRLPEMLESADIAESLGADLVTVSDHPSMPSELEAWSLMSVLLARTERVRVAPNVTPLALRSPAMIAKAAATLQVVGQGRFVLGLGVGGPYEQIPGFGGSWPTVGEAVAALDEAIPLIRRLWGPDPVDHGGPWFQLEQAAAGPVPDPPVPIWVGAFKPRMLAITGRHADGWLPTNAFLDLGDIPGMQRRIDEAAVASGREPSDIERVFNVMGEISDTARRRNDQLLVGPVEHWVDVLSDYRDRLGFDSFVFWPVHGDTREQIRLFFDKVRPQLDA